jgi:hypothetical protein
MIASKYNCVKSPGFCVEHGSVAIFCGFEPTRSAIDAAIAAKDPLGMPRFADGRA